MAPSKKSAECRAPPPGSPVPPFDSPFVPAEHDVFEMPLPPVDQSLSPSCLPRHENPPHLRVDLSPPPEPRGRSRGRRSQTPPPVDAMRVMERMMQSQHDFLD